VNPVPTVVGAGPVPAPATQPEEALGRDVEGELVDLLCDDEAWLDEAFREIVAASFTEPPRGGSVGPSARPRRFGFASCRAPRHDGISRSQWCSCPHCRQRSPPRLA
jgi:hypothetical protein